MMWSHILFITFISVQAGDALTTGVAAFKGNYIEANPVLFNLKTATVLKSSETIASGFLMKKLERRKPRLARIMMIASIGINGYATYHNIKELRKLP